MDLSKKEKFISIAIPIHKTEKGNNYLSELLESIRIQKYLNYEVVISDSSQDSYYTRTINNFSKYFVIKHIPSDQMTLATNANNAILNCSGEIIKPMFSDDLFISNNVLSDVNLKLSDSNHNWLAYSSYDFLDKENNRIIPINGRVPSWNRKLILGKNTIGAPSVIAFKSLIKELFDTNLRLFIDCDFYYRLKKKYGNPIYSDKYFIGVRHHAEQETELIKYENIIYEKNLIKNKYKILKFMKI